MRQMLIRVPDDLHRRLTKLARREGVSVNALANQLLSEFVAAEDPADDADRRKIRDKARDLGILVDSTMPPLPRSRIDAALESTKGIGPVLDDLWAEGR